MLCCVLLANVADAKPKTSPKDRARAHFKRGQMKYSVGQFEQALEAFSSAYEIMPLPAFLFNIGQCHRNLKNYERAVFFFEGYLRETPTAKNRGVVEDLLAEARHELEKQQQQGKVDEERLRREKEARLHADEVKRKEVELRINKEKLDLVEKEQKLASVRITAAPPPPATPVYKTWWFWTATGGAVAVVAGVVTTLIIVDATNHPVEPLPVGSLGSLDRRQGLGGVRF
jgi:tetratricopeptide (TPR) repeat protein